MSLIPGRPNAMYLFYMECGEDKNCVWSDEDDIKNPNLHFGYFADGKLLKTGDYKFFLPIKDIYVEDNGAIAVTMEMPNSFGRKYKVMISRDYGKQWMIQDMAYMKGIKADYVDLNRKEYWVNTHLCKVFKSKTP